ncbi:uncharacterized protein LOC117946400 isoform X2 [Etheostoma cragini]|uniref:uncharacterized protein LOC117946400 isoform X2 n=1 Tax=Etheostoma cragini TaxID=417921 RepID=UPI00155EBBFB|nr:uncharacterized protein LOC117946400 isoform X2 [Etheostoma cragini]XP_034730414.1 uncharacterized protein LOC117946400 isoform X2 [Etheostoma cragini]
MKNLILVALILVITVDINGFQFGDIISFKPRCKPILGKHFYYQHFAVYVGDRQLPGKEDGQNIFERLKDKPSCVFSTLDMDEEPKVTNDLDGYKDEKGKEYKAGTEEEITTRINEQYAKCRKYNVLKNNCEHLATYVRYGVKVALQFNMTGENLCFNNPFRIKTKDMVKYVRENAECHNNVAGLQVFPQLTLSAGLALLCFVLM